MPVIACITIGSTLSWDARITASWMLSDHLWPCMVAGFTTTIKHKNSLQTQCNPVGPTHKVSEMRPRGGKRHMLRLWMPNERGEL